MFRRLQIGSVAECVIAIGTSLYAIFYVRASLKQNPMTIPWFGVVILIVNIGLIGMIIWRMRGKSKPIDPLRSQLNQIANELSPEKPKRIGRDPLIDSSIAPLRFLAEISAMLLNEYGVLSDSHAGDTRLSLYPLKCWPDIKDTEIRQAFDFPEKPKWDYVSLMAWKLFTIGWQAEELAKSLWEAQGWREPPNFTQNVSMTNLIARLQKHEILFKNAAEKVEHYGENQDRDDNRIERVGEFPKRYEGIISVAQKSGWPKK